VTPREYLNAEQLAAVTPWSKKAIAHMVEKGVLMRGVHYFQPQGPGTRLLFKWSAIVEFIEHGAVGSGGADGRTLDVDATAAALERLLVRESRGPAPAALPDSRPGAARPCDRPT
jgi:hypothetical protein